jgi:hypothetical protein
MGGRNPMAQKSYAAVEKGRAVVGQNMNVIVDLGGVCIVAEQNQGIVGSRNAVFNPDFCS